MLLVPTILIAVMVLSGGVIVVLAIREAARR
jgi:hypothetical protein